MNEISEVSVRPFYIQGSAGKLFALLHGARNIIKTHRYIVCFPPFAEESNKSRKMINLQAREFAKNGYDVLIVDYFGTGDSEGDFSEATWDIWKRDFSVIAGWLEQQQARQIILWGLRFGALMALQAMDSYGSNLRQLLFWQPILSGDQMLSQFLRLRLAADMLTSGNKMTVKEMKEILSNGNSVEVAGYSLNSELYKGIEGLNIKHLINDLTIPVTWFEVVNADRQEFNPATRKVFDGWPESSPLSTYLAVGEAFWTTPEIAIVQDLIEKTNNGLEDFAFGRG